MYINNLASADFDNGLFSYINIEDNKASNDDLNNAFQKIKSCQSISINSNQLDVLDVELHHIKGLNTINIEAPNLEKIDANFFPKSITKCRIRCEKLKEIPSSLFDCTQLRELSIDSSTDNFSSLNSLPNLVNLSLNLSNVEALPKGLFSPTLQYLNIISKRLASLPEELSKCVELKQVRITAPIAKPLPNLYQLDKLQSISLTNLELIDFGEYFQFPSNLTTLAIRGKTRVQKELDFTLLWSLTHLQLDNFAQFPKNLYKCTRLRSVYFNHIDDQIFPDLSNCQSLTNLIIDNVPLIELPASILQISGLLTLQISHANWSSFPKKWEQMPLLESLSLIHNNLAIDDFDFISNFPKLKRLELEGNTLTNPYALISQKKLPLMDQYRLLKSVRYNRNIGYNRRKKEPSFLDFCAALGRTTLPISDKKWFFDLIANHAYLTQAPALDFPQFLKGLNINFSPLRKLLERKLIRDVLIQHLSETDIFQNPFVFDKAPDLKKGHCLLLVGKMWLSKSEIKEMAENLGLKVTYRLSQEVTHVVLGQDADNWKEDAPVDDFQMITESALQAYFTKVAPKFLIEDEQSGDLSMVKNVVELLENEEDGNILLALELMKGGGVPKMVLEKLLIHAKTAPNTEVRKKSKELLLLRAPQKWLPLIKNRLEFHSENLWFSLKDMRKKMVNLSSQIEPELTAFFIVLLQQELANYPEMLNELDEILYEISKKMKVEDKLLQPGAVIFVNGTTRLKKTEIKEKLEAANLVYSPKYTKKVTHVLIGKNPKTWDLDSANFKILTENHLQTYLSEINPSYLEQAADEGDVQMTENLRALLYSPDESNVAIALEMIEGGGVPLDLLAPVLVISKSVNDAKIRAKARKLLELYAPVDWLPLIKSKLLFKGITGNSKENDLNKKLDKLAKETSFEVAAILSIGLFQKYGRGLRFMMRKSNRTMYLEAAKLLLDGTHFNFAKGLGYKDWRNHAPEAAILMGMMKTGINFPDTILELGKIESIDFHNCKLTSMPKSITKFADVKELDFSHNSISKLPLGIHKLEKLEVLNLKMNCFDEFPMRIATIKSLKKVDLSHNRVDVNLKELLPQYVKDALPDCEFIL